MNLWPGLTAVMLRIYFLYVSLLNVKLAFVVKSHKYVSGNKFIDPLALSGFVSEWLVT